MHGIQQRIALLGLSSLTLLLQSLAPAPGGGVTNAFDARARARADLWSLLAWAMTVSMSKSSLLDSV